MLIGEIIGTPAKPLHHHETSEEVCRRLTSSIWGRYVALLTEGHSALSGVFRDPSGAIDCAVRTVGSTRVICSATPAWLTEGIEDRARISWTAIAGVLKDPITLSTADVLADWSTIAPGVLFTRDGAMRSIWSPGTASRALEPRDAAGLRSAVDLSVAGLTQGRCALLVEISGGLDSAIMASSLRAVGFDGEALWLNTHGPFAESDERSYATAVADRLGVRLNVIERTREDLTGGLEFDHPRTLRPGLNRMDAAYDRLQSELCDARGIDGILTGKGGDVAFLQTATSAILADQIRDQGFAALFGGTAPVLARRMRRSAWRTLRAASAGARNPRRYQPAGNSLLHVDIRELNSQVHPWLLDLDEIGPGKRQQVVGFASNLGLHGPSRRSLRADLLHPALSQPVMEAVLATPSHVLTLGGHDRLLARLAFAERLPPALVERRSKAELGGYYGRVLAANLDRLRPHLLEGRLANQGLIDREQVEAALRIERLIWQGAYAELLLLALVESWVSAWAD